MTSATVTRGCRDVRRQPFAVAVAFSQAPAHAEVEVAAAGGRR